MVNYNKIKYVHMELIYSIYKNGNITKASLDMNIPRSTANRILGQARYIFNDDIFVTKKGGKDAILTDFAKQYIEEIEDLVIMFSGLFNKMKPKEGNYDAELH